MVLKDWYKFDTIDDTLNFIVTEHARKREIKLR